MNKEKLQALIDMKKNKSNNQKMFGQKTLGSGSQVNKGASKVKRGAQRGK